ncbi:MAG TPA: ATP-binding protein [Terriglobia bacterium]|nr:ATP-binding protein [Terriglobia bacterium]
MTVHSPIFRKLLFTALLVVTVTLLALDIYLVRYTAYHQTESLENRLAAQAGILAGELRRTPVLRLGAWVRDAAQRSSSRVTLIGQDGDALADSEEDAAALGNLANRPEVQQARTGRRGVLIRKSKVTGQSLCYVSIQSSGPGHAGTILRLAVPVAGLDRALGAIRWRILGATLIAALLALILAYFFSRVITQRIVAIEAVSENLVSGSQNVPAWLLEADDELGALARSLNRAAGQLRDLIVQLKAESASREAILASMREGVVAVDHDLRLTFFNESFSRLTGVNPLLPPRTPLLEAVRDLGLSELLGTVLAEGKPQKATLQLQAAGAHIFEVQATPLAAGGNVGAIAILHDITELERLERVRRDFVANVSHELRTPLTAIRGYAEALLEGALDDPAHNRNFVEVILAHSKRLGNIASDLLILSELESGREATESERVNLRAIAEGAMRTVEAEAQARGVSLKAGRLEDAEVLGHRLRLEQAILNLVDNAVKFNQPGGEVRIESGTEEGGRSFVCVADTGIGIPSDHLSRIFERFYRVDKARSREVGGTGLGLSIVKHILERMGGTVQVESRLGKGSTFTIFLPNAPDHLHMES